MNRLDASLRWVSVLFGLRRPVVRVRCAWCVPKRVIGEKACPWSQAGLATDSICEDCRRVHFPVVPALFPVLSAEDVGRHIKRARETPNEVSAQIRGEIRRRGLRGHALVALLAMLVLLPVLGFCGLQAAGARQRADEALLAAIALVENAPAGERGSRGEFTRYQFLPSVWAEYTTATVAQAERDPALVEAVAQAHLDWLRRELHLSGVKPTARNLAMAWNAGATAVIKGRVPLRARDYGQRVVNLMEDAR